MDNLFKINYNACRITLSARELHAFLGVGTEFAKWMQRMCEYGFTENQDYRVFVKTDDKSRGRPSTDYEITIEMAKEIAMIQRNDKGKQARQYFIEVEKKWNSPEYVMNRALEISRKRVLALENEVETMRPKALFADAVATAENSCLIGELAKILKANGIDIGQRRLFDWLRENGYLMKSGESYNLPTQKSMNLGLMEIKKRTINNPDGSIRTTSTTKVTGKGQVYFVNKFLNI